MEKEIYKWLVIKLSLWLLGAGYDGREDRQAAGDQVVTVVTAGCRVQ